MSEKQRFITQLRDAPREVSFAEICRAFGISRQTGYKWRARYEELGEAGLRDKPPLAKEHKNATAADVADQIVALRKERPSWGPKKLRAYLEGKHPDVAWPAVSTFGAILDRRGMIVPAKPRLRVPPAASSLSNYDAPNAVWCVDHKGDFPLADGTRCAPLTLIDGYSRFLLRCEAVHSTSDEETRRLLIQAFREFGLPNALRSDGGTPFATASSVGRLTRFAIAMLRQGIELHRNDPGCPQQNGRLERLHRTLMEAIAGGPYTREEQQRRLDFFRKDYNHDRPHEALDGRAPGRLYERSWRAYREAPRSPQYLDARLVRSVSPTGVISWRDHRVSVGMVLAGEQVYAQPYDDDLADIYFCRHFLCTLDTRAAEVRICHTPPDPADPRRRPPEVQFR